MLTLTVQSSADLTSSETDAGSENIQTPIGESEIQKSDIRNQKLEIKVCGSWVQEIEYN